MRSTCPDHGLCSAIGKHRSPMYKTPYQLSSGMFDDPPPSPDPLDEFLAQLLRDTPDYLPDPITEPPAAFASASTSTSASPFPLSSTSTVVNPGTTIIPYYTPTNPELSCQWQSPADLAVCSAPLSADAKEACTHLRQAHNIRGNEKVMVQCYWHDCHVPQMQRGSLIRHMLTVHLGLLRWQCGVCGRSFSRKGTAHACVEGG